VPGYQVLFIGNPANWDLKGGKAATDFTDRVSGVSLIRDNQWLL